MTQVKRRLVLLLSLLAAFAGAILPGTYAFGQDESGAGGDNAAVAVNQEDGSSLFDLAFSVRRVAGDVVDQQNVAVAYSSCESCQTIAIAIQVLIVTGSPETVTPENVAIAINENCTMCQTLALAYQFVFGGDKVWLTPEGQRQIAEIRTQFYRLRQEDLEPDEIQLRTDELATQLRDVLSTQLSSEPQWGRPQEDADVEESGSAQPDYDYGPAQTTETVPEEETAPPPAETVPDEEPTAPPDETTTTTP